MISHFAFLQHSKTHFLSVRFVSGHPRNNLMLENTFLVSVLSKLYLFITDVTEKVCVFVPDNFFQIVQMFAENVI